MKTQYKQMPVPLSLQDVYKRQVFGALGCIDLETGKTHVIPDKPVHQLWFDDDTYMATRQYYDGSKIEMETSRIQRFTPNGECIETLGGIGNHIDGSPDRSYFVGDRAYPGYPTDIFLYRRGETDVYKRQSIYIAKIAAAPFNRIHALLCLIHKII